MSYTYTYTYALLPEKIEDAVGCILIVHPNIKDKHTISVYGRDDKYVFTLSEVKDYHKSDNDRIYLYPIEEYGKEHARIHAIANMIGYEKIKEIFVCVGNINDSQIPE